MVLTITLFQVSELSKYLPHSDKSTDAICHLAKTLMKQLPRSPPKKVTSPTQREKDYKTMSLDTVQVHLINYTKL